MSVKADVLDLIIEVQREHEEALSEVTHRLEELTNALEALIYRLEEVAMFIEHREEQP